MENELRKLREIVEKQEEYNKKLVDSLVDSLEREQEKNEITVKTLKEITKQNAIKEVAIVAFIRSLSLPSIIHHLFHLVLLIISLIFLTYISLLFNSIYKISARI